MSRMTTTEKRDELLACIQQLNETNLDQAYRLLEAAFPRLVGWDSDKLNEEIARDFYESEIFPDTTKNS